MRPLHLILILGAIGCSRGTSGGTQQPAPARSTTPQDTSRAASGRQAPDPTAPKPYNQIITASAVTDSGVFLVHRIGEKLYYEIPRNMFGRQFRMVVDRRGTIRGIGYVGEQIAARVVRWDRVNNRVLLRMISYAMRADSGLPVARSVDLSNTPPILKSFDVAAWSRDSNAVIEVTSLFTTDVSELNVRQLGVRVRRFDPTRSFVERARSFPLNVEVTALQTFEIDSLPGAPGAAGFDRSLNSMTIPTNFSMVLLPARRMQPRQCDNRMGYFSLGFEDYGADEPRVPTRCYITRWRLEPKDSTAAVSDPVKPIVFYVDPATPERWASWIIKGVRMWEPVFRAAGFSNAINARRAPTAAEDPDFDVDDARYSTIRWLPSTIENAYGPHVNDPRTGEILQSNIGWFHNITSLLQAWYWVQVGAVDPRARRLPFPDSLMGDMVAYVAAHEVAQLVWRGGAGLDQAPRVAHQRIACLDGLDVRDRAIRLLRVATGVSPQAHRRQVKEDRLARRARVVGCLADRIPHLVDLAVSDHVAQMGEGTERVADPARRGRDADPGAIVLAHEEERHRQPQTRGIACGVDGGQRAGVGGEHPGAVAAARCRSIAINGTIPEPPPTRSRGPTSVTSQTKCPPIGPRSST